MLLSRFLRDLGYFFSVNKIYAISFCFLVTFIFGIGLINLKLDVFIYILE
jgi:hypothetical protein